MLGCGKRMDDEQNPEGDYYQRYRVCQAHLTLSVLLKQSVPQRFCQVPRPLLQLFPVALQPLQRSSFWQARSQLTRAPRWLQQCGRFHHLSAFDGNRRFGARTCSEHLSRACVSSTSCMQSACSRIAPMS